MLLRRHQANVQWSLVVYDRSTPLGLCGPANLVSPVSRQSRNASLESPAMILPEVSAAEMPKQGKTTATNGVVQGWLVVQYENGSQSALVTKSDQCTFSMDLRHHMSNASNLLFE